MAIIPLPQATIHLLGSSQTLTTSLSLVKELIDNGLDAKATSIDVLISQNTLDKVEVRDNGHGISQEDLDVLGRRGHTSKLRSFDELRSIGGISLGFRGEALASAVQLGEVSVTTKMEGEVVATCVMLKAPGGILKQTRTSHPVGTTVCVKNFISKIPVRKQTALKAAPKTLIQIKELLQSYALARPTIKFSLKVMKENKGSWSFVPRSSEGIRGAVSQILGREAAIECSEKSLTFPERKAALLPRKESALLESVITGVEPESQSKNDDFVVEMFLPKPDADPTKIGQGQYLSVDSRPIANDKGTMRKLVTLYKSFVRASLRETADRLKNPFLRMNINCPIGSYDPNVEPAKDDILFGNEEWVIESIENFFKHYYGVHEIPTVVGSKQSLVNNTDDFQLLLARKNPASSAKRSEEAPNFCRQPSLMFPNSALDTPLARRQAIDLIIGDEELASIDEVSIPDVKISKHRSKWDIDMSKDLSEDVDDLQLCQNHESQSRGQSNPQESQVGHGSTSNLNPWVIAKLTAPVRPRTDVITTLPQLHNDSQQPTTRFLLTPNRSSDPPVPTVHSKTLVNSAPRRRRVSNSYQMTLVVSGDSPAFRVESPVVHDLTPQPIGHSFEDSQESELLLGDDATVFARRNDFISARNVTDEHIAPPSISKSLQLPKEGRANLNKPFISPVFNVKSPVFRDNLRQTTPHGSSQMPYFQQDVFEEEEHPDLAWSMDFEHRKEELTRQQRQKIKAARSKAAAKEAGMNANTNIDRASPHKNRYRAALATLTQEQPQSSHTNDKQPIQTIIPEGDPRAYLIRKQGSMSAKSGESSKLVRARSNRLPLEKIPEAEELHSLMLTIPINIDIIQNLAFGTGEEDPYIRNGNLSNGLLMTIADTPHIIRRIQDVAVKWKETKTDGDMVFEYKFSNLV